MEWVPTFNFRLFVKTGGVDFQKNVFSRNTKYALNTSLKKRIFSIEIVKINIWMIISYFSIIVVIFVLHCIRFHIILNIIFVHTFFFEILTYIC